MNQTELKTSLAPQYYEPFLTLTAGYFSESSQEMIIEALTLAATSLSGLKRHNGIPLVMHSIETAVIVMRDIGLGRNSVISTLLHDVVRLHLLSVEEVGRRFGQPCIPIIKGLCNISELDTKAVDNQADNFRELIVSYSTDPRVILIKLADRLEVMRILECFPAEKRKKKSWGSLHLYAQIAHKLGLYEIKSELEDISLRFLEPDSYHHIQQCLSETAAERDQFIRSFVAPITQKMDQQNYQYSLKSRTKSVYSIWRKMKSAKISFDEVYDLFAIRIILDCPAEREKALCWGVYSIVTDFYTPNPERMRDWISIPKSNGYESLHTTVVTPQGRWVEIQIRSERMDEVAERGVAAHWRYKGIKGSGMGTEEWFAKLRELIETTHEEHMSEELDGKLSSGEIFVFTPKGDLRKLRKGATVLDFAYDIHSDLGATCVGGKVNHRNVPFKEELRNGNIVEVLTAKSQKPKPDWLQVAVTSKALGYIKAYLREEQANAALLGREELERKLKNWKLPITIDEAVSFLCKHYKIKTGTELYSLFAQQKILVGDQKELLQHHLNRDLHVEHPHDELKSKPKPKQQTKALPDGDALSIDNMLSGVEYKLAKCCNPIYGDEVFGFTTINSGVTIHRHDCPNAARLRERYPYRILSAKWRHTTSSGAFRAIIRLQGEDRIGLLNKITETIHALKVNIRSMNLGSSQGVLSGLINIEVTTSQMVDMVIYKLTKIAGVQKVFRVNN